MKWKRGQHLTGTERRVKAYFEKLQGKMLLHTHAIFHVISYFAGKNLMRALPPKSQEYTDVYFVSV